MFRTPSGEYHLGQSILCGLIMGKGGRIREFGDLPYLFQSHFWNPEDERGHRCKIAHHHPPRHTSRIESGRDFHTNEMFGEDRHQFIDLLIGGAG